jgi:hypothetical protein
MSHASISYTHVSQERQPGCLALHQTKHYHFLALQGPLYNISSSPKRAAYIPSALTGKMNL